MQSGSLIQSRPCCQARANTLRVAFRCDGAVSDRHRRAGRARQLVAERLDLARAQAQPATFTPHDPEVYRPFRVFDVEFSGAGGDPVRAWYIKPGAEPASIVVKFIGYGGGRGAPAEHMLRHLRAALPA